MRSPRWLPSALSLLAILASPLVGAADAAPVWQSSSSAVGASWADVQLAHDAAGNTVVVWRKSSSGADSVWTSTIQAGSTTFGTAKRLSPAPGAGELPQITDLALAVDSQGSAVAAWTSRYTTGAQPDVFIARRSLGSWSAAQPVSDGNPASSPAAAFSATGTAVLAWRQSTSDYNQIRVSALDVAAGTLTAVQSIAPAGAEATLPKVAFDAQGNGVISWVETAVTFSSPYVGAVTLRASTRKAGVATFTGAQQVYQTRTATIDDPAVVVDSAGNATIAWGNRLLDSGEAAGVFASTRVVGATSWPGAPLSTTGAEPEVAASFSGGAVVTWVEHSGGAPADAGAVMAAHRAPATTTFDLPVKLSADAEVGTEPTAVAGSGGTTVIAWTQQAAGGDIPRASVKAPSSSTFWPAVDLGIPDGALSAPAAAVNASGSALVLWQPGDETSTLQRIARLDGSSVSEAPAPEPTEPTSTTPTPTTPTPTTPTPTTPTEPTPTTPSEPTPTTPAAPTPTTPSTPTSPTTSTPTPTTTTPTTSGSTPTRAPVVSIAKDPTVASKETTQVAGTATEPLVSSLPSLRAFKALAPKRFKPASAGTGLVARGDGLPLAATGNLDGTLRIVVTSTPKDGKAKNLKPALTAPISDGTTKLVFTGRLAGKPLPAGLYKLKAVFVDTQGRASNRRELSIAIKR